MVEGWFALAFYHFLTAVILTLLLLNGIELVGWIHVCGTQDGRKHLVMFAKKKKGGGKLCIGIFVYYFYYISPFSYFFLIVLLESLCPWYFFFLLYRLLGCLGSFCVGIVRWFVEEKLCEMGVLSLFRFISAFLSFLLLLLLYTSN